MTEGTDATLTAAEVFAFCAAIENGSEDVAVAAHASLVAAGWVETAGKTMYLRGLRAAQRIVSGHSVKA